jgi:hypothetical protein
MNQAKSLISINIFSLACFPHTGTNAEDYSCTPLNGYLPAELHRANYSLGMLTDCHRLGAPN